MKPEVYFVWICGCLVSFLAVGCVKPDTVKHKVQPKVAQQSCIKGKLVKEENNTPLAYVPVLTEPTTSPQVTDKYGIFEICYRRKQDRATRQSVRAPLSSGKYTLVVRKENYKPKRVLFAFQGKPVNLGVIRLRGKHVNLPDHVKRTRPVNDQKDSGITGPAPKTR